MNDPYKFLISILPMVVGIGVTWFFAWFYYKRAGDELRTEAKRLRNTTSLILSFLENRDAKIIVKRDALGEPVGLVINISGTA